MRNLNKRDKAKRFDSICVSICIMVYIVLVLTLNIEHNLIVEPCYSIYCVIENALGKNST
ncbi:MAG: hypothetical protein LIO71_04985 [Ruminococcus sp.]|nr:hypothetical protein [Ruminococcus sp.]MCD7800876.1 hypothetical protein [Ruminococcus sp.]